MGMSPAFTHPLAELMGLLTTYSRLDIHFNRILPAKN